MQLDKNLLSFASLATPLLPPTKGVTVQISHFFQGKIKLGVFVDVREIWNLLLRRSWNSWRLRRPVVKQRGPNLTRPSYREGSSFGHREFRSYARTLNKRGLRLQVNLPTAKINSSLRRSRFCFTASITFVCFLTWDTFNISKGQNTEHCLDSMVLKQIFERRSVPHLQLKLIDVIKYDCWCL